MKYQVILSEETDGDCVCNTYDTLEEAQEHLRAVRYYPEYRRTCVPLDIAEDGMSGTGNDYSGDFTYYIQVV